MKTFAIIGKAGAPDIFSSLLNIADFLSQKGHGVVFENNTAQSLKKIHNITTLPYAEMAAKDMEKNVNCAIVVGGDGTMLAIARQLAPFDIPLIGIHYGRLGFMADITLEQIFPALQHLVENKMQAEKRHLLRAQILRKQDMLLDALALNDIVVSRTQPTGMAELSVEIDGQFMYHQRCDGLIIATPTGSTAYALSVGGPLLHPKLHGFLLVAIAPHALSHRPIVVPDDSTLVITVINTENIRVNFDMQSFTSLKREDRIVIRRAKHAVTFLHPPGWSYYDTLRKKFHWNSSAGMQF